MRVTTEASPASAGTSLGCARVRYAPQKAGIAPSVAALMANVFHRPKIQAGRPGKGGDNEKRDERRTRASWDQRKVFDGTGESYRGEWCASKGSGEDKGGGTSEEGMPPDRRRAGGGKIQARIQSVIEPTALASVTPHREWRGRGIVRGGAGTSPSAARPVYNTGSLEGGRKV